jgi:hypothetical protein
MACCPAHDDKNPSMSVRAAPDGKIAVHCFAVCDFASILGALGVPARELMGDDRPFDPRKQGGGRDRGCSGSGARKVEAKKPPKTTNTISLR